MPQGLNISPLSQLTGRDQYLVSLALAASIALLDRAAEENWQASALADMNRLLATMVDDTNSLETIKEAGNEFVSRALSRAMDHPQ